MTRVVVAAGIDNELESKDIAAVKRLKQAGYEVDFYYYLPKIPAEFSMIPSFNEELQGWRKHAIKMLEELGNKLDIPEENRHFADEILGPDRVFDEAKNIKADIILTSDSEQLRQGVLSRAYDILSGQNMAKVPVTEINSFAVKQLGPLKETRKVPMEEEHVEEITSSLWAKKKTQRPVSTPKKGLRDSTENEQEEISDEDKRYKR